MTSASSDRPRRRQEAHSPGEFADRLDRLSVPEAERVLERAIELEAAAVEGPAPNRQLTTAMLERIASELGIDVANLRRALDEERLRIEIDPPTRLDGLIGPKQVVVHGTVTGDLDEIRQAIDTWMTTHEGMRKRADHDGEVVWERDRSFGASLTHKLSGARGTGVVRRSPRVGTSVQSGTTEMQQLVISVDTGGLRIVTSSLLAVAAIVGGAVTGISSFVTSGLGLGEVAGGLVTFAALGGAVVTGARSWVRRLSEGAERVLDAVRSPHLMEGASLPFGLDRWLGVFRR